jgi:sirohydrochlorin cobaltochelatase
MHRTIALISLLFLAASLGPSARAESPPVRKEPVILLVAFGTSTEASVVYDRLDEEVRKAFPEHLVRWAFTSSIIREKLNRKYAEEGRAKRLLSPRESLVDLWGMGYTHVAAQSLLIFPGEEQEEFLRDIAAVPDVRVELGEPLMQRWDRVTRVLDALAADFLPPEEGINVVVAHGTPSTNSGSNLSLLAVERRLRAKWPNAVLGAVEGMIGREEALAAAKRYPGTRVRFFPLMYTAGDHIMNDVMGRDETGAETSWLMEVEAAGKKGETLTVPSGDGSYYKGLGFYPVVNELLIAELRRALGRL